MAKLVYGFQVPREVMEKIDSGKKLDLISEMSGQITFYTDLYKPFVGIDALELTQGYILNEDSLNNIFDRLSPTGDDKMLKIFLEKVVPEVMSTWNLLIQDIARKTQMEKNVDDVLKKYEHLTVPENLKFELFYVEEEKVDEVPF